MDDTLYLFVKKHIYTASRFGNGVDTMMTLDAAK